MEGIKGNRLSFIQLEQHPYNRGVNPTIITQQGEEIPYSLATPTSEVGAIIKNVLPEELQEFSCSNGAFVIANGKIFHVVTYNPEAENYGQVVFITIESKDGSGSADVALSIEFGSDNKLERIGFRVLPNSLVSYSTYNPLTESYHSVYRTEIAEQEGFYILSHSRVCEGILYMKTTMTYPASLERMNQFITDIIARLVKRGLIEETKQTYDSINDAPITPAARMIIKLLPVLLTVPPIDTEEEFDPEEFVKTMALRAINQE